MRGHAAVYLSLHTYTCISIWTTAYMVLLPAYRQKAEDARMICQEDHDNDYRQTGS